MNIELINSDRNSYSSSFRINNRIIPSLLTSLINNISDRRRWQEGSKMQEVRQGGYRRENLGMLLSILSRYIACRPWKRRSWHWRRRRWRRIHRRQSSLRWRRPRRQSRRSLPTKAKQAYRTATSLTSTKMRRCQSMGSFEWWPDWPSARSFPCWASNSQSS